MGKKESFIGINSTTLGIKTNKNILLNAVFTDQEIYPWNDYIISTNEIVTVL
jgi:hypothetical protein